MKTWRVELTVGGESLAEAKTQKYIPGRCSITITIHNSDDTTQPHTQEMHSQIQTW